MEGQIETSALAVVMAIFKVFVIIALGYVLKRRRFISEKTVTELTRLVITIIVPCFLFNKVYHQFSIESLKEAYRMGLFAAGLVLMGALFATIASRLLGVGTIRRHSLMAVSSFNNAAYLPIPLVYALLPQAQADKAAFYIAIYVLVISPIMWSWGVWLLARKSGPRRSIFKTILTPPAIGILFGVLCALEPCSQVVERVNFLVGAAEIIGDALVPLSMIIVGTLLASITISKTIEPLNVTVVAFIKLILMPGIALLFITYGGFPKLMGLVMLIQAAVPPAANLAIIARNYEGDFGFISTTQLVTYLLTPITLPIFISLYLP